jgi:hypothetical protein
MVTGKANLHKKAGEKNSRKTVKFMLKGDKNIRFKVVTLTSGSSLL